MNIYVNNTELVFGNLCKVTGWYDHHPQHISIDSPMARALLSKQVDDGGSADTAG